MHEIIDVASDVSQFAAHLADAGVKSVIRYYNHRNSNTFPSKCLTSDELGALTNAGLSVAVVFEQRGGAGGHIEDFDAAAGAKDAKRALLLAQSMNQPRNSAIYFAVDSDFVTASDLAAIQDYFEEVRQKLSGSYLVGIYGSGTIGVRLKERGLVDHIWLAGATAWSGTRKALREGNWTVFQNRLEIRSPIGGFEYDGNVLNPSFANFGQFSGSGITDTPAGEGVVALFEVNARDGLNLRSGPAESFRVVKNLDSGTLLTGTGRHGNWMQVDLEGDGQIDGYVGESFLSPVSGGLPLDLPLARHPIDFARGELALGVREIPGRNNNNPRIVLYHKTTRGGVAPDETAWCSSFVNYCVQQAGLNGTNSKWARSWHEKSWGSDVSGSPTEGDIVVFRRQGNGEDGGHVGFYIGEDASSVTVLGGNQGNRISVRSYPKNGVLAPYHYTLLSIRRGG